MLDLYINEDGSVEHVYDDALAGLLDGDGEVTVRRASHVEPCRGGWTADLAPVGGPTLGPFARRAEALAAEHAWLDAHLTDGPLTQEDR